MIGSASIAGCNQLQRLDVRARRESEGLSRQALAQGLDTRRAERDLAL
jgi:hypothetical protein